MSFHRVNEITAGASLCLLFYDNFSSKSNILWDIDSSLFDFEKISRKCLYVWVERAFYEESIFIIILPNKIMSPDRIWGGGEYSKNQALQKT